MHYINQNNNTLWLKHAHVYLRFSSQIHLVTTFLQHRFSSSISDKQQSCGQQIWNYFLNIQLTTNFFYLSLHLNEPPIFLKKKKKEKSSHHILILFIFIITQWIINHRGQINGLLWPLKSVNILLPIFRTSLTCSVLNSEIISLFPQYLPAEHVALYTQISRKQKRAICSWRMDTLIYVSLLNSLHSLTHLVPESISVTSNCY